MYYLGLMKEKVDQRRLDSTQKFVETKCIEAMFRGDYKEAAILSNCLARLTASGLSKPRLKEAEKVLMGWHRKPLLDRS